jgi:myo-inositol-1(or 4)-monophosphatase
MNPDHQDPGLLRKAAEEAAAAAGGLVRQKWDQPRQLKSKGFRDIVTDADTAAQDVITTYIREHFPDHGFMTEEETELTAEGPVVWIIDPVDGTTNYSRQIPIFCVSIAAAVRTGKDNKELALVAGAIYDPLRDEMFSGAAGLGATLNNKPIEVSQTPTVDKAIVGLDWSREPEKRQAMLDALGRYAHEVHTVRATGSAALGLVWVAAGRFDVYLNFVIGPWDVAAAKVIIGEAGGVVTDCQDRPWVVGTRECCASNGQFHQAFLELF